MCTYKFPFSIIILLFISCSASTLTINFLSSFLAKNIFISLSFFKYIFSSYKILQKAFVSLNKDVNPLAFGFHNFWQTFWCYFYLPSFVCNVPFFFPSTILKDLLFAFGFQHFYCDISNCSLVLLYFGIYLCCHFLNFLICGLTSSFGRWENSQPLSLQNIIWSSLCFPCRIIVQTLDYFIRSCRLLMLSYI